MTALRLAVEHVADQAAHPFLFGIEPAQQRRVLDRLQRSFAFFEASRLRHRIALQVRFEMTDDLDSDASDVRGDLVCGPSVAGAHRLRSCLVNRRQERVRFTASLDHCTLSSFRSPAATAADAKGSLLRPQSNHSPNSDHGE